MHIMHICFIAEMVNGYVNDYFNPGLMMVMSKVVMTIDLGFGNGCHVCYDQGDHVDLVTRMSKAVM